MRKNTRLDELVIAYFTDDIRDEERAELEAWLLSAPEARRRFARLTRHELAVRKVLLGKRLVSGMAAKPTVSRGIRSFSTTKRTVMAIAASIVLALGLYTVLHLGTQPAHLGVVAELSGEITLQSEGRPESSLRAGDPIYENERLASASGASMQLNLQDGSVVDLNENTKITLLPATSPDNLLLETGDLYCVITKRRSGQKPFAVRTGAGHRAVVPGTTFELNTHGPKTAVKVEAGKVRLECPNKKSGEAGPLQMIEADADRIISASKGVMLHQIACWKFKQDDVPPGTILFQDDFEGGLDKWETIYGDFKIVSDVHAATNHCLQLRWNANEKLMPTILARFIPRHKNFEVTYKLLPPKNVTSHGFLFWTPPPSRQPIPIRLVSGTPEQDYKIYGGRWHSRRYVIRGLDIHRTYYFRGKVIDKRKGRIVTGSFRDAGLIFDSTDKNTRIYVDDFVIKKLAD